jgi:glycosyltransferase involved in cell wall biosynthesis
VKILYPLPELLPDGRARFIQIMNTSSALSSAGAETILLTGRRPGWTEERIKNYYGLSAGGGPLIRFLPILRKNIPGLPFSWGGVFEFFLLRRLRSERGVILVRHPKLARFLLQRKHLLHGPVIFEAHEIFSLSAADLAKKERLQKVEEFIYKAADGIITISTKLSEDIKEFFNAGPRSIVIPNAIRDDWVMEHGMHGLRDDSYIFYAGSLYAWKGIDTLIEAMSLLPAERLYIAGGGKRLDELREYVKRKGLAGRINFLGELRQEGVVTHLRKAKLAVVPNLEHKPSEYSSPLKLFEFMGAGIPVVASDLPGIRDVVKDGREALLFRPGDARDLARKILRVTNDMGLAERLARNASVKVKEFTYSRRAARILQFIQDISPS